MLAAAAAIVGVALAGSLASLEPGPPGSAQSLLDALTPSALSLAAGLAAIVIGLAPAFLSRTALRTVIGLLLVLQGVVLARIGIAGQPGELEQLGVDGLVVAVGAAGALLATLERRGAPDAAARQAGGAGRAMTVLLLAALAVPGGLAAFLTFRMAAGVTRDRRHDRDPGGRPGRFDRCPGRRPARRHRRRRVRTA